MNTHPSPQHLEGGGDEGQRSEEWSSRKGSRSHVVALPTVKGLGRAESTTLANYPQARYNYG